MTHRHASGGNVPRIGRIVVSEFVSLDGVMEDPGGSLLLGRRTYRRG
jgi:hypothetical protein